MCYSAASDRTLEFKNPPITMDVLTSFEQVLLEKDGAFLSYTYQLMAAIMFWGVYAVIFAFSIYCMSQRETKTKVWLVMLTLDILLFMLSTGYLALTCVDIFLQTAEIMLSSKHNVLDDRIMATYPIIPAAYATNLIFSVQFLIGDAIVIWRTWALWEGSWILSIPIVLWTASLGSLIAERILFVKEGDLTNGTSEGGVFSLMTACYALSVATNGVSTALIALKAWKFRKFMKESLRRSTPTAVERIFEVLVESGLLYFCFWSISIINNVDFDFGPALLFRNIWTEIGSQVVGLYPTVIIALVELQRSMRDNLASASLPTTGHSHAGQPPVSEQTEERSYVQSLETTTRDNGSDL